MNQNQEWMLEECRKIMENMGKRSREHRDLRTREQVESSGFVDSPNSHKSGTLKAGLTDGIDPIMEQKRESSQDKKIQIRSSSKPDVTNRDQGGGIHLGSNNFHVIDEKIDQEESSPSATNKKKSLEQIGDKSKIEVTCDENDNMICQSIPFPESVKLRPCCISIRSKLEFGPSFKVSNLQYSSEIRKLTKLIKSNCSKKKISKEKPDVPGSIAIEKLAKEILESELNLLNSETKVLVARSRSPKERERNTSASPDENNKIKSKSPKIKERETKSKSPNQKEETPGSPQQNKPPWNRHTSKLIPSRADSPIRKWSNSKRNHDLIQNVETTNRLSLTASNSKKRHFLRGTGQHLSTNFRQTNPSGKKEAGSTSGNVIIAQESLKPKGTRAFSIEKDKIYEASSISIGGKKKAKSRKTSPSQTTADKSSVVYHVGKPLDYETPHLKTLFNQRREHWLKQKTLNQFERWVGKERNSSQTRISGDNGRIHIEDFELERELRGSSDTIGANLLARSDIFPIHNNHDICSMPVGEQSLGFLIRNNGEKYSFQCRKLF